MNKKEKVSVSWNDFLQVTIKQRETIDTAEKAAEALGYTTVQSFKNRLKKARENYAPLYVDVPKYPTRSGPHVPTLKEAQALLKE